MAFYQNFLFDWDGTLADTSALHAKAFHDVIAKFLPDKLSTFRYTDYPGCATREVFRLIGTQESDIPTLTSAKQNLYLAMVEKGDVALLNAAETLLQRLKDKEKNIFLVTGGSRRSVEWIVKAKNLGSFFAGIITADDVNKGKPSPESYHECLIRHALRADESIALEDAPHGVASAQSAGLPVIGLYNSDIKDASDFWYPDIPSLISSLDRFAR